MRESVHRPDGHVTGSQSTPPVPEQEQAPVMRSSAEVVGAPEELSRPPENGTAALKREDATAGEPDADQDMQVVEVERPVAERRGVRTGLTRDELLATLAIRKTVRDFRLARLGRAGLGPARDREGPARRRRLRSS